MLRSLLIKVFMLGMAITLLMLMGWPPPPEEGGQGSSSELGAAASVLVSGLTESATPATAGTQSSVSQQPSSRYLNAQVDLNRATVAELQRLPTIGQVLAERIVKYRNTNGLYNTIEQLLEVRGIGRIRLERLRRLLSVPKLSPEGAPAGQHHRQSLSLVERPS